MKSEMTLAEYRAWLARPKQPRAEREHQEQVALINWARLNSVRAPELALLFAVPNGGDRHPAVAAKLAAEGVQPGVPDLCLPVARQGYYGMYIELKAPGGEASEAQEEWIAALRAQGYWAEVIEGWVAAARKICLYLGFELRELGL